MALPQRPGGEDELLLLQRQDLPANNPRETQPFVQSERDDQQDYSRVANQPNPVSGFEPLPERRIEYEDGDDDQQQTRDSVEDVQNAHHQLVESSAEVSGD